MIESVLIYLIIGLFFATSITIEYANRDLPIVPWYQEITIFLIHWLFWPVWVIMLVYFYLEHYIK